MPRGARTVSDRLLAGAPTSEDNAFKLPLVERTLASIPAEAWICRMTGYGIFGSAGAMGVVALDR
jgi:hypothetical protein